MHNKCMGLYGNLAEYRPRLTTFDLFHTTILKITKEIFVKICWQLKTPTPT